MPSALSKAVKSEIGQTWLIGGRVQGVGFRPFVCVMANELGVRGSVRNRGGQVEVIAIGEQASVELLLLRLLAEHPPIARPELIAIQPCAATADCGFRILPSGCGNPGGAVLPDESTCVPAVRPRDNRNGGISALPLVPGRIRKTRRSTVPRAAHRMCSLRPLPLLPRWVGAYPRQRARTGACH